MPTPEARGAALQIATEKGIAVQAIFDGSLGAGTFVILRQSDLAEAFDRFAAQRGAEQRAALAVVPEYPKQSYMAHFAEGDAGGRAHALLRGRPVGAGDGDTFVPRAIGVEELTAALRDFHRGGAEAILKPEVLESACRAAADPCTGYICWEGISVHRAADVVEAVVRTYLRGRPIPGKTDAG